MDDVAKEKTRADELQARLDAAERVMFSPEVAGQYFASLMGLEETPTPTAQE